MISHTPLTPKNTSLYGRYNISTKLISLCIIVNTQKNHHGFMRYNIEKAGWNLNLIYIVFLSLNKKQNEVICISQLDRN